MKEDYTFTIDLSYQEKLIISEIGCKIRTIPAPGVTYLGFSFEDNEYAELRVFPNNSYKVWLTKSCQIRDKTDGLRAVFQMAHEMIHLVAPAKREDTNFFEEGLATFFQFDFIRKFRIRREGDDFYKRCKVKLSEKDDNYFYANSLVEELQRKSKKSIYTISKQLLIDTKLFSQVTHENLQKATGISDIELFDELLEKFYP